jgi:hypothetical protein
MDASEYKNVVLGLIFLKYVSDAFDARRAELDAADLRPGPRLYFEDHDLGVAGRAREPRPVPEKNVFWVPPEEARWDASRTRPSSRTSASSSTTRCSPSSTTTTGSRACCRSATPTRRSTSAASARSSTSSPASGSPTSRLTATSSAASTSTSC